MPGRLFIDGARVIDPSQNIDEPAQVIIARGRIQAIRRGRGSFCKRSAADRRIDARGCWVLPGVVDLHVHLREPGQTAAEDISSGTRAAAAGGVTTVVCQPNTQPVIDSLETLDRQLQAISSRARVRVVPSAALTLGLQGRRLAPLRQLVPAGAGAVSDDGVGTASQRLLEAALRLGAELGAVVMVHCQDHTIGRHGVIGAGRLARRLGLPVLPQRAETRAVRHALQALRRAGCGHLHVQHVSCRQSLALIARAKEQGLPVTCEATPHHLFLSDKDIPVAQGRPDTNFKMNPPLRRPDDVAALRRGLALGVIDAVASDHAPHTAGSKARDFLRAPFGVIGLETLLPLVLSLIDSGELTRLRAVEALTRAPAAVLGRGGGSLRPGSAADLVVVEPRRRWRLEPERLRSRSRNSPFLGWSFRHRVRYTLVGGRLVFRQP